MSDKNGGTPSGILIVIFFCIQILVISTVSKLTIIEVNNPCEPR